MCISFDSALYPIKKYPGVFTLCVNNSEWILKSCNCEVKLQMYNVAYNLNRNLWAIIAFASEKLQI